MLLRQLVLGNEIPRAPNPLKKPDGSFENIGIRPQKSSQAALHSESKQTSGEKGWTHTWVITSSLQDHFKHYSIAVAQSLTVDFCFSDYIWSSAAKTTGGCDKHLQDSAQES